MKAAGTNWSYWIKLEAINGREAPDIRGGKKIRPAIYVQIYTTGVYFNLKLFKLARFVMVLIQDESLKMIKPTFHVRTKLVGFFLHLLLEI